MNTESGGVPIGTPPCDILPQHTGGKQSRPVVSTIPHSLRSLGRGGTIELICPRACGEQIAHAPYLRLVECMIGLSPPRYSRLAYIL